MASLLIGVVRRTKPTDSPSGTWWGREHGPYNLLRPLFMPADTALLNARWSTPCLLTASTFLPADYWSIAARRSLDTRISIDTTRIAFLATWLRSLLRPTWRWWTWHGLIALTLDPPVTRERDARTWGDTKIPDDSASRYKPDLRSYELPSSNWYQPDELLHSTLRPNRRPDWDLDWCRPFLYSCPSI